MFPGPEMGRWPRQIKLHIDAYRTGERFRHLLPDLTVGLQLKPSLLGLLGIVGPGEIAAPEKPWAFFCDGWTWNEEENLLRLHHPANLMILSIM